MSQVEQPLKRKPKQPRPSVLAQEVRSALSVAEACDYLCIGLSKLYAEMHAGRLKFRKSGKKTLIRRIDADNWLDALPDSGLTGFGRRQPQPEPETETETETGLPLGTRW